MYKVWVTRSSIAFLIKCLLSTILDFSWNNQDKKNLARILIHQLQIHVWNQCNGWKTHIGVLKATTLAWLRSFETHNVTFTHIETNATTKFHCLKQLDKRLEVGINVRNITEHKRILPWIESTKSSLHSCVMSFLNFPSSLDAHFCLTSTFSL